MIFVCFACLSGESKRGLSILHDSNSFSMMEQTNNSFIQAQMSPGLTKTMPHAVSLGCVGEKWATEAKQRRHWNTQDNKEVMTCCIMGNASERGCRRQMYDLWCARNPTSNVTEQRLMDQRRLIVQNDKLMKLEIEDYRRKVDGQSPFTYVLEESEQTSR